MANKLTPQIAAMYLGCEVETPDGIGTLCSVGISGTLLVSGPGFAKIFGLDSIKLILRPLSDITEIEFNEAYGGFASHWSPESFLYLLSKHFDLFGLIEAGLAIDKTTTT